MYPFKIVPKIENFTDCQSFIEAFEISDSDIILTNPTYYEPYFKAHVEGGHVIYMKDYGKGEPTDQMVEAIYEAIKDIPYSRVIAIGGGSIIDVSKLLTLKHISPVESLYDRELPIIKDKALIIVPTTCGTGSEVTSVSVLEIINKHTKMGLQDDALYADYAILIPELIEHLPDYVFATSSIDALIHATESYLSPKATRYTKLFSLEAIRMILRGYQTLKADPQAYKDLTEDFLVASTYAGIAFGNAGCAAVHAMSMAFSASYHVPHGESNYILFTEVLKTYEALQPSGALITLKRELEALLDTREDTVFEALDALLGHFIEKKQLRSFGVQEAELAKYVTIVETRQGRLTANNFCPLDGEQLLAIYQALY